MSPRPDGGCLVALLLAACGGSGVVEPVDAVLAEAVIGPGGGEIGVTTGELDGLSLRVPPGALPAETAVRVVRPAAFPTSVVVPPGLLVRLEPPALEFLLPATLRLPYRPQQVHWTAPGNVRAQHVSALGVRLLTPVAVDVTAGRAEFEVSILGSFLVVEAEAAASLSDYLPRPDTKVAFEGGLSFAADEVANEPFLTGRGITRWTIADDGAATGFYLERRSSYIFDVVGRFERNATASWQEIWRLGAPLLRDPMSAATTPPTWTHTSLFSPFGSAAWTGTGSALYDGVLRFSSPLRIGDTLLLDVVELQSQVHWSRGDLGPGESELVLWFAPGRGVVALQQDGRLRLRTDL